MLKISNEIIKRQIISAFLKLTISNRSVFFSVQRGGERVWSVENKSCEDNYKNGPQ